MKKKVAKKGLMLTTEKVRKLADGEVANVGGGEPPEGGSTHRSTCPHCPPPLI